MGNGLARSGVVGKGDVVAGTDGGEVDYEFRVEYKAIC
jgi:hypothetical protein